MRFSPLLVPVLAFSLSACTTTLYTPPVDGPGCQVRAGAAYPEGSVQGGFAGGTIAAVGGAATVIGDCPQGFNTYSRSANGSEVCMETTEGYCREAREQAPVEVTPAQLREMIAP